VADETGNPLQGKRVLVVEDEYLIADDLVRALTALGARIVGPAGSLEQGLDLARSGDPLDLAVLDINLHGRPVFPLADLLAERAVPFLFATGYDAAAIPSGYADVPLWEKPFDVNALARALAGLPPAPGR
jgi:CheY-like chemotaxis protein